jgi:hypothetical protein
VTFRLKGWVTLTRKSVGDFARKLTNFEKQPSIILSFLPRLGFKKVRRTYSGENGIRMAFLATK